MTSQCQAYVMMTPMSAFDSALEEIRASVVRMLSLVRESSSFSRKALIDADVSAAERTKAIDVQVDALQEEVEMSLLTLIARHQPAASDLRHISAIYRAIVDIERAGDYAVHVANAGAELAAEPPLKKYLDLDRILVVLDGMFEHTIKAMVEGDEATARQVIKMDDEIDELDIQIQRELLTYMMEDPHTISKAARLITVTRFLERLGDHLENVNEHVVFWLTGQRL